MTNSFYPSLMLLAKDHTSCLVLVVDPLQSSGHPKLAARASSRQRLTVTCRQSKTEEGRILTPRCQPSHSYLAAADTDSSPWPHLSSCG